MRLSSLQFQTLLWLQLMEDLLEAVGLGACGGMGAEIRQQNSGAPEADANAVGDGNQVDETGGDGWVTPKGWTTLY